MHQVVHELELVKNWDRHRCLLLLFLLHTIAFSKAFTCNLYHSDSWDVCKYWMSTAAGVFARTEWRRKKVMECFHIADATDFDFGFNIAVVK